VREYILVAEEAEVSVADGRTWRTWTYNGRVPGPEIRAREGERLRITLENRLPQPTTIHWHGLPVPNRMDGVPGVTQDPVAPGARFTYEFVAEPAGTYFYHSHVGLQLDRGLQGALVIEPRDERSVADAEVTLLLDDWLTLSPEEVLAAMAVPGAMGPGGMMGGMPGMGRTSDPPYAGYLLNGRTTDGATAIRATTGQRVRLRLVNAASATTFRIGLTGHRLLVTHADGQAVRPVEVDTLIIGMGERYDVLVTAANPGAWALVAGPVDSVVPGVVVPFLYEGRAGQPPSLFAWPSELRFGRQLRYGDLAPFDPSVPAPGDRSRTIPLTLGASMMGGAAWTINGQAYPHADPIVIRERDRIRLQFRNATMVRHPMHLHGHFFRLVDPATGRASGPIKDTVIVEPMGAMDVEFLAENPGAWLLHCHHAYHMEAGMARVLEYR
jgi:FtsP/CotA-like multicopper oxidase with cupredoxin domain